MELNHKFRRFANTVPERKSPKTKYISWLNPAPLKCNGSFHCTSTEAG